MKKLAKRKKSLYARSASLFRWIHIYISMLGFSMLMFFAFTGLTLNHPTWFGAAEPVVEDIKGELPEKIFPRGLSEDSEDGLQNIDKLTVAEWLRATHHLRGQVAEFEVNEFDCMVVFKGPGYAVDVFIERDTGSYFMTKTASGLVAIMNDLHKGRDSGGQWSWVIDVSAIVTMLMSLSGFGLIFYIRRRRVSGVISAVAGTLAMLIVWYQWVP